MIHPLETQRNELYGRENLGICFSAVFPGPDGGSGTDSGVHPEQLPVDECEFSLSKQRVVVQGLFSDLLVAPRVEHIRPRFGVARAGSDFQSLGEIDIEIRCVEG